MSTEIELLNLSFTTDYEQLNSSSSENEEKNTRRKPINRRIIVAIALTAIFVTIVVVLIIKLSDLLHDRKTTISFNMNTNSAAMKYEPIITEVGRGGTSGDAPCQSHTVIDGPTRSISNGGIGGICDNGPFFNTSLGGRWIRFVGKGGTRIPTSPVGIMHCGAFVGMWMNTSLPMTIGTSINVTACWFMYSRHFCFGFSESTRCSIMNCGDFYVYFLAPIGMCNGRYCTV